ncbi:hypothetical protein MUJ63_11575 [Lachnospiraceae bacterium NSJ-143]|nr:hypothetical protein [Lachnospiraceae bacterium NSJ-143]
MKTIKFLLLIVLSTLIFSNISYAVQDDKKESNFNIGNINYNIKIKDDVQIRGFKNDENIVLEINVSTNEDIVEYAGDIIISDDKNFSNILEKEINVVDGKLECTVLEGNKHDDKLYIKFPYLFSIVADSKTVCEIEKSSCVIYEDENDNIFLKIPVDTSIIGSLPNLAEINIEGETIEVYSSTLNFDENMQFTDGFFLFDITGYDYDKINSGITWIGNITTVEPYICEINLN